jgi:hypothetical protein
VRYNEKCISPSFFITITETEIIYFEVTPPCHSLYFSSLTSDILIDFSCQEKKIPFNYLIVLILTLEEVFMTRFIFVFSLITLVSLAGLGLAGIPKMINYQGMLTDNSGTPLTGSYNLTFKIWTDTTGGSSLWTETQNGVQVQNGLFNVILGRVATLNLPFDQQYWLEVAVGAETMPRLRFTSVGYAYRASIADSATVAVSAPTGGGWTDGHECPFDHQHRQGGDRDIISGDLFQTTYCGSKKSEF